MNTRTRLERLERLNQEIEHLPLFAAEHDPATGMWKATNGQRFCTEQQAIEESLRQPILPLYVGNPYSD